MRQSVIGMALASSAGLVLLGPGCSSSGPPAPNSFTEVYTKVIQPSCTSDYCHYNGVGLRYSGLDMSSQVIAYWSLVNQPAMGASCSQMGTRVIPGYPEDSLLYTKVSQTMPSCGSRMPADVNALVNNGGAIFSGTALGTDLQNLIYQWISDGAQDN